MTTRLSAEQIEDATIRIEKECHTLADIRLLRDAALSALATSALQAGGEPVGYLGHSSVVALQGGRHTTTTITQHRSFDDDHAIYLAAPASPAAQRAVTELEAVLCDPEGNVCIHGSPGDREVIQKALRVLKGEAT